MSVKFYQPENQVPLEMHKVRVIQKLNLLPVEDRLRAIQQAGCNTFLLQNKDIYLDMLTDSGVNAMSDRQTAAMQVISPAHKKHLLQILCRRCFQYFINRPDRLF